MKTSPNPADAAREGQKEVVSMLDHATLTLEDNKLSGACTIEALTDSVDLMVTCVFVLNGTRIVVQRRVGSDTIREGVGSAKRFLFEVLAKEIALELIAVANLREVGP